MTIPQLAPEILQRIALSVATDNREPGPPSGLLPLLTSSPRLYASLNAHDHPHLYAEIFRYSFDTMAIRRRFPNAQLTAHALSIELKRRWTCLKRIRRMAQPQNQRLWSSEYHNYGVIQAREDLMTAYLMLVESDGLNAVHLLHYAQIDLFLEAYWQHRLLPIHYEPEMPKESEETSLLLWVMWLVTDYRKTLLRVDGKQLTWILTPYMLGTFFYNHTYAPWVHHTLPLSSSSSSPSPTSESQSRPNPHATVSTTTTFTSPYFTANLATDPLPLSTALISTNNTYLGNPFTLTPPFAATAATLMYSAWIHRRPLNLPTVPGASDSVSDDELVQLFDEALSNTPSGDASVFANLSPGDAPELERRRGRSALTPIHAHIRFNSVVKSWVWDDEWRRLTRCLDCRSPSEPEPTMVRELGLPTYAFTRGSLMGEWDGGFIVSSLSFTFENLAFKCLTRPSLVAPSTKQLHSHNTYTGIMEGANPLNTLEDGFFLHDYQSWSIEEHYVYDAAAALASSKVSNTNSTFNLPALAESSSSPSSSSVVGLPAGSPLDGFVPYTASLKRVDAKLVGNEWKSGYETFERSSGEVFYETWRGGKRGNDVDPSPSPSSSASAASSHSQSAVKPTPNKLSLLLTGISITRPASIPANLSQRSMMPPKASTTLQGTVRTWDGLITVRAVDRNENGFGVGGGAWVWRGYLVGEGNLVGRWRDGAVEVGRNAYEGVFVMRRRI
ncbi:hypothetical protein FRB96_000084 [Tulasnella sp. 330]|nr:hypothetical protein FRB96_000084 [Tulasnella sp. 330]